MLKAPCKDCPDRYLGCHDHCDKFKEYDVERKRIRELKAKLGRTSFDYREIRNYRFRKDTHK